MADLCMCGHEERAHYPLSSERACMRDCACGTYLRSPRSAFRGPRVTWTRAEASRALLLLNCGGAAYAARNLDPDQLRDVVRIYVQSARENTKSEEPGLRILAPVQFLAARILRAVRA